MIMIVDARKTQSLTFYQTTTTQPRFNMDSSYVGGLSATTIATTTYTTATTTTQFNNQLNAFLDVLHEERENCQ